MEPGNSKNGLMQKRFGFNRTDENRRRCIRHFSSYPKRRIQIFRKRTAVSFSTLKKETVASSSNVNKA